MFAFKALRKKYLYTLLGGFKWKRSYNSHKKLNHADTKPLSYLKKSKNCSFEIKILSGKISCEIFLNVFLGLHWFDKEFSAQNSQPS